MNGQRVSIPWVWEVSASLEPRETNKRLDLGIPRRFKLIAVHALGSFPWEMKISINGKPWSKGHITSGLMGSPDLPLFLVQPIMLDRGSIISVFASNLARRKNKIALRFEGHEILKETVALVQPQ